MGTKFRTTCAAIRGSLPLTFTFSKENSKIHEDFEANKKIKIETGDDYANLIIASIEPADSGKYSCSVSNAFGASRATWALEVRGLILEKTNLKTKNFKLFF